MGEMMLTEAQVQQFKRDGYLKGGRVLDGDDVGVLQEEIARVIRDIDRGGPQPVRLANLTDDATKPVWQIVNIWEGSGPFRVLIHNQQIAEEMAQLTGAKRLRIWHDQIQYKPAEHGGVNMWHQDAPLWPILAPMTEVTAWVALDDVGEDNGCMRMVPGSHLWGNAIDFLHTLSSFDAMPAAWQGHAVEVRSCPVRKGEVHYHHALAWHGSPANLSGRHRRAIALHFMTEETRYVAGGEHLMKRFVEVADGEVMAGTHFPLVWEESRP
jgi:ectoine hydroxylase-related dioxygenase (phytanoyl-CoA dioxygenase family)